MAAEAPAARNVAAGTTHPPPDPHPPTEQPFASMVPLHTQWKICMRRVRRTLVVGWA